MQKKSFSLLTAMLVACVPLAAQAQFPDVSGVDPNYDAIEYVADKGIVQGYPNGNFEPNISINRAEFVKILVTTVYSESDISNCKEGSFTDVPADAWYAPYVCVAKKNHVVDGYDDKTFKAENSISFVEAAKILRNTMLANELIVPEKDYDEWYGIYVDALSQKKAIPVSIKGLDAYITRGEMAEMIYRLDAKLDMLTSLSFSEMNDRKLIESYYNTIAAGKLEEAYNMKVDPEMGLEAFKALYKDFSYPMVTDFNKTAVHTFTFSVRTFPNITATESEKSASELYDVKMEVVDGKKLKTLSSKLVTTKLLEETTNGNDNASLEWENGSYKIYVFQNGEKSLAVEHNTKDSISPTLQDLRISPTGKYLMYQVHDWEFGGIGLYDIANHKEHIYMGIEVYGFTEGDENFYFCSSSGMSSGEVSVTDLPGFENIKQVVDLSKKGIGACGPFDKDTNTLHYETFISSKGADSIMMKESYTIQ
jgi:hypothetical protein